MPEPTTDRINGISQVPGIPNADGTPYKPPESAPPPPPGSGVVSSSTPVVADENATKNNVAGLSVPDPNEEAARKASEDYMKLLEQQQAELERQRQQDLTGIGAQFDEYGRQLTGEQNKERATTSVALQRIGGYLGGSASSVGALNNLAQTHRQEVAALQAKKTAAIQAANNAINSKRFDIAKAMAQEAKDLAASIADRRDKFFTQSLQLTQEKRQQDEQKYKRDTDTIDSLASTFADSIKGMKSEDAAKYIQSAAKDLKLDPNLLLGAVNSLSYKQRVTETASVTSLASKYLSAGINPQEDDFATASAKVRNSKEYKLDIRKSELEISKMSNSLNEKPIDYSSPILSLYANATGKIVSSPSEVRAILGYTESILGDKEIIPDDTPFPARIQGTITESDARKLLSDSFVKFGKGGDDEVPDSDVWMWIAGSEASSMTDSEKKQTIMEIFGKNPEDFGIY